MLGEKQEKYLSKKFQKHILQHSRTFFRMCIMILGNNVLTDHVLSPLLSQRPPVNITNKTNLLKQKSKNPFGLKEKKKKKS